MEHTDFKMIPNGDKYSIDSEMGFLHKKILILSIQELLINMESQRMETKFPRISEPVLTEILIEMLSILPLLQNYYRLIQMIVLSYFQASYRKKGQKSTISDTQKQSNILLSMY